MSNIFNKIGLGTQLSILLVFTFTVIIGASGYIEYTAQLENLKNNKKEALTSLSSSISSSLKQDIYTHKYSSIENKLTGFNDINVINRIAVYNTKNRKISEVKRNKSNHLEPTYQYTKSKKPLTATSYKINKYNISTIITPVTFAGKNIAWLEIQSSPSKFNIAKSIIIKNTLYLTLSSLFVAILTIVIFLKKKLKPLDKLTKFSERLPNSNGETLVLKNSTAEIDTLLTAINWASKQINLQKKELKEANATLDLKIKERTKELQAAKEAAEKSNDAKSQFLSSMSHELRTPLNAVLGFAQLLEADDTFSNNSHKDSIKEILAAGNLLQYLIDQVLDFGKIETNNLEITIEDVDLNEVIKSCVSMMKPLAKNNNLDIEAILSNKTHIVRADPARIKQVLLNILRNAVKYNCKNGKIQLEYKKVNDNRTQISVTDTGIGIKKGDIDKVFLPFERVNYSSNVEGTGIGLSICKQLVELMNGSISVESTPDEGTTVCFELDSLSDQYHNNQSRD